MGADLDVAELHLTIKNYVSRQPYVDSSSGLTSLDMPYEAIEFDDVMFEAKVGEIPTAKVTLPSLIAQPGLRPLLQKLKEGDRVELFNFQPDCGRPAFAGFIPPNGIEEQDGKVILNVEDTLGQLRWQHLKRYEYLSASASGLYDRARSIWVDLLNEDFLAANTSSFYGAYLDNPNPPTVSWRQGFVQVTGTDSTARAMIYPTTGPGASFTISPGDTFLLEADVTMNCLFTSGWPHYVQFNLQLEQTGNVGSPNYVDAILVFQNSGVASAPYEMWCTPQLSSAGAVVGGGTLFGGTNLAQAIPMPASHHLSLYVKFDASGTATAYVYLDNVNVDIRSVAWNFDATTYQPQLLASSPSAGEYIKVTSWRASKLLPSLLRAGRFNPQTPDAVTYQPNNEDNLQFLQLIAEKDGAEFRPLYNAWPQIDELELDAAGTLGGFPSRTLGYEQPSALPTEGSPQAAPVPAIVDVASFLTSPPFRFEEGYNLEAPPRIQPRASAHSNDVIRVGASTADSQVFAEKWLTSELGKPQQNVAATYPRFEQITNDDRIGIQSIVASLAGLELARRTDAVPSLEVNVVEELPFALRWRAGDQVFTKTQSLRTNIEQEMRVQRVRRQAGSPVAIVTLGHMEQDPTMLRMLAEDTKISWLYDQSGTNPGVYVYPSTGNILSGATSAAFTIPLDQYTTGSALVYAALHWFADANVMLLKPVLNGVTMDMTGRVGVSGTESGLVIVTNAFQGPGSYTLQFNNSDSVTRNLTGAFLVLRIKG